MGVCNVRILLLYNSKDKYGFKASYHLGLEYIAAMLKCKGIESVIAGYEDDDDEILQIIRSKSIKYCGLSMFKETLENDVQLLSKIKRMYPEIHIFVGGHYATFTHQFLLTSFNCIDTIILGEGDYSVPALIELLEQGKELIGISGISTRNENGEILVSESIARIENLDDLPNAHCIMENVAILSSSRGCYGSCTFCSINSFYGDNRWIFRTVENLVNHIEYLVKYSNIKYLKFVDDNFIGDKTHGRIRAFNIAKEIINRKIELKFEIQCRANDVSEELFTQLFSAGLRKVFLGIESGSKDALIRYHKSCNVDVNVAALKILRKIGIVVDIGFIMYDLQSTWDETCANIDFLLKNDIFDPIALCIKMIPYEGTHFYKMLIDSGEYEKYEIALPDNKCNSFYLICREIVSTTNYHFFIRELVSNDELIKFIRQSLQELILEAFKSINDGVYEFNKLRNECKIKAKELRTEYILLFNLMKIGEGDSNEIITGQTT